MTEAAKLLNKQLERGKIDGLKMAGVISTIHPTLDYSGFERVDVVVEAVVENPKVKKAVLAETEDQVRPDTVLASNTSTIPINELASALKRPENFCGMHFFNPVHRMPLVEIIRGEKSSDETIAKLSPGQARWAKRRLWLMTALVSSLTACCFPILPVSVSCCATGRISAKSTK